MMMDGRCGCYVRLCPVSLGIAIGIVSALCMMLFAWSVMWWGVGGPLLDQYGSIYYGFGPTWMGGLWGALWGLIEGFISGLIIGLIYNCLTRMCARGRGCCANTTTPGAPGTTCR